MAKYNVIEINVVAKYNVIEINVIENSAVIFEISTQSWKPEKWSLIMMMFLAAK